jgi:hypothetical protein
MKIVRFFFFDFFLLIYYSFYSGENKVIGNTPNGCGRRVGKR